MDPNQADGTETPAEAGLSPERISRRRAMKAAVGSGVAAATFVAPRVEGLSIAPDYAAAASGTNATNNATINATRSNSGTAYYCLVTCCMLCWNANGIYTKCAATNCTAGGPSPCQNGNSNDNYCCGNPVNHARTGTLTVNKNVGSPITLNYNIWGGVGQGDPPSLNLTISGIDPPFQSCTVTINGSCNAGGFRIENANNNSTFSQTFAGNNGNIGPLAPRCASNPSLCNDNASITISLACTFT
jgi:hypothetical protein